MYSAGEVSYEDAILHADSPNDLRLMIKLGTDASDDPMSVADGLTLEESETAASYRR